MKLPRSLEKEIIKAARRKGIIFSSKDAQDVIVSVDDSFSHDGMSGAEIQRVAVSGFKNNSETHLSFVVKPWESTKWLTQLLGVARPLENILFENGYFDDVNAIERLYVPIVGSIRFENKAWIVMEDVSKELAAWKTAAFGSVDLTLQCELLDRIAFFHVNCEHNQREEPLQSLQKQLVPQERRLRWFEELCQEWCGGKTYKDSNPPALRKVMDEISQWGRDTVLSFLERLPETNRINWRNHMLCRDGLVTEASKLPAIILHGDLLWKNIGLRQETSGNTFVLIDWEIATLGHHAFDVYSFISEPFRDVDVWDDLFDYYFERYLLYGGSKLNRDQWNRGVELAIAHYGLSWLPLFAEWTRNGNDAQKLKVVENIIERTNRALYTVRT